MRKQYRPFWALTAGVLCTIMLGFACFTGLAEAQRKNGPDKKIANNKELRQIYDLLKTKYVMSDQALRYAEQFKRKFESGEYNSCLSPKEFTGKVTADLRNITSDQHIYFRIVEPSQAGETAQSSLHHPVRYHLLGIDENKGFSRLEWLKGNIGYMDIRRFYNYPDVRDMVISAIEFLSNANAIIIDIRENGGGSGDYLSSYFLEHPTQLCGSYSREDDYTTEFWTIRDIGTERLTEVPLFVLTSGKTFSASESFAYDMQSRKRATIVGDSTRGGAHSVDLYQIGDQFEIYISTARAVSPVTGTNWEGTGVVPDVAVPAEAALDTAIVLARRAGAEYAKARDEQLKQAVEVMETRLARAEQLFRDNLVDEAGVELDSMLLIAREHGLVNEFFMDVLAYNYSSQADERILYAVIKKKIQFFPASPTAYESLGYAYFRNNKKDPAIEAYQTVLELEPDNRNAANMIKRMRRD